MKTRYKRLFGIAMLTLCFACGKTYKIGDLPSAADIKYSATPSVDNPNIINFSFLSDGMSPNWRITKPDGSELTSNKRNFSLKFLMAGEYTAFVHAYGGSGVSEEVSFTFTVPENDPLVLLLAGEDGDKVWMWDSQKTGHLACGWIQSATPDWWITVPNELNEKKIYDDELNFSLNDYKYNLDAHGYVYVEGSAIPIMGGSGSDVVAYEQPEQTWSVYEKDDGALYLKFSNNGFPSYVAGPAALGAEYKVLELTEDKLYLKWDDKATETSWYYLFKVKGDDPEPETEMEVMTNYLTGKDAQKVWVWDNTTAGSLSCGDISSTAPDWWITEVDELADFGIYDDELSFIKTGNAYNLDAHSSIYVNPEAENIMNPNGTGNTLVPYTQPAGETWSLTEEDGTFYLSFSSGAFPSYVADPAALGAKYEVLTLTESTLYLRWKDNVNYTSWYYRFKIKD